MQQYYAEAPDPNAGAPDPNAEAPDPNAGALKQDVLPCIGIL
ncbi:MAG: hypothetical protein AAFO84_01840 [Cyanobacteria bacterium J06598_1]